MIEKQLTLFDQKVWDVFVQPGDVLEVRIPKVYGKSKAWRDFARGTVSGYFDDHEDFTAYVQAADQSPHNGIYFSLQRIDPRLLARAYNRLKPCDLTTSDRDVLAYRWLPVDCDPIRPAGIPSSDQELAEAMELRDKVAQFTVFEMGFNTPIRGMSGNGGHLLFRLPDLPVNEENINFLKETLQGLSDEFSNDSVIIDTGVFNPARIWKLYGTTAKKGDDVPEGPHRAARPHRMAYIDDLGDCFDG